MPRHDDETFLERRNREENERKLAACFELTGALAVAGEITGNGVCYTKEALQGVADRFKEDGHPAYGVVYKPEQDPAQLHIADIAFSIKDVAFDGQKLEATIRTLPTPQGEMVNALLELEQTEPGSFALAMAGMADNEDIETLDDGTKVVSKFEATRISILPAKEKA